MGHTQASRKRRLVYVGGTPRRKREPRPCSQGHHRGPFVRRADLDQWLNGLYAEVGVPNPGVECFDCLCCGSSISAGPHRREVA